MVDGFWGVETCGAGLRACAASPDYDAGLIQDGAHMRAGGRRGAGGGTYNHHGVMLKVELESDG